MNIWTLLFLVYGNFFKADCINWFPVTYELHTRNNTVKPYTIQGNNITQLQETNFDPNKQVVFVAHGRYEFSHSSTVREIQNAIFKNHDVNLFLIDWQILLKFDHTIAQKIAEFINYINTKFEKVSEDLVLIGFGDGAHILGAAASIVNFTIDHIIGLDPPKTSSNDPKECLDKSDAKFVEVIHTDGKRFGTREQLGHIDFYVNGEEQPNCQFWNFACSHLRAYTIFAESLERGSSVFQGVNCPSWKDFLQGKCNKNEKMEFGNLCRKQQFKEGCYYLATNNKPPYGLS